MSHTVATANGNEIRFVLLTIVNYAVGGEPVSAADAGVNGVDALIMGSVPPTQNSLGAPLFPILTSGKIVLYRFVAGVPTEIPATTALNAVVPCLVHVSIL